MRTWKKLVAGLVAVGLTLAPNPLFAQYGSNYFWWQVIDEVGKPYGGQSAVECSVYEVVSHGAALMHFDAVLSPPGSTQPLLGDETSKFHFYSQNQDDKRVICFAKRGGVANDVRLDRFTHRIMIDRQGRKIVRFAFTSNATNQKTGIWIPQGSIIRDVLVQNLGVAPGVVGQETHLNVGFSGNHVQAVYHAFVYRMHLSSTDEFVRPGVRLGASRAGGDFYSPRDGTAFGIRYHVGGSHRGVALAVWNKGGGFQAGGCSFGGVGAADEGSCHYGLYLETPYVVHIAGGIELTYQTSTGTPGLGGHVYILYDSFHVGLDQSITK